MISLVWIISFLICFPPLLGWGDPAHPVHPGQLGGPATGQPVLHSGFVETELCSPQVGKIL